MFFGVRNPEWNEEKEFMLRTGLRLHWPWLFSLSCQLEYPYIWYAYVYLICMVYCLFYIFSMYMLLLWYKTIWFEVHFSLFRMLMSLQSRPGWLFGQALIWRGSEIWWRMNKLRAQKPEYWVVESRVRGSLHSIITICMIIHYRDHQHHFLMVVQGNPFLHDLSWG